MFTPKSAQVNVVWEALNITEPQLLFEPLSISAATIVAFPPRSNGIVMFWHIAVVIPLVSTKSSFIRDVLLQPLVSVTVKLTSYNPLVE